MKRDSLLGASYPRIDGLRKARGDAKYMSDLRRDEAGVLDAVIVRSPHPRAHVCSYDTADARSLPGVAAVLTAHDVSHLQRTRALPDSPPVVPVLTDRPAFVGDAVAAVAAIDRDTAVHAAGLIKVEYEVAAPVLTVEDSMTGRTIIHDGQSDNLAGPRVLREQGDVGDVLASAAHVFDATYTTSRQCAQTIEPLGCLCEWDDDETLHVWTHLDNFFHFRELLARAVAIDPERIAVHAPEALGATFGLKNGLLASLEPVCALLSAEAGRPVRLMLSPEESMSATVTRHASKIRLRTGVSADGRILARTADVTLDAGAYGLGYGVIYSMLSKWQMLYPVDAFSFGGAAYFTNHVSGGAYRGVGTAQIHFAMESQIDEICRSLAVDPIEFRRDNMVAVGDVLPGGTVIRSSGLGECMEQGAAAFGWGRDVTHLPRTGSGSTRRRGVGMAIGMHHSGLSGLIPGIAEGSESRVAVDEDGRVVLDVAAVDKGQGAATTFVAIVSELLKVDMSEIDVRGGSTATLPFDLMGAEASRSTFVMGRAVVDACERLLDELCSRAASLLDAQVGDVTWDGVAFRDTTGGEQATGVSWAEVVAGGTAWIRGRFEPRDNDPLPAFGAHFCEVEVDMEIGSVRVLRYVAAQDVGRVINRLGAEGQAEGGVHHGLGYALLEGLDHEGGQPVNGNFASYRVLMAPDMPEVTTLLVEVPDPDGGPWGAKGIGTPVIPPVAPAVANAIADATGARLRDLPMLPHRVLAGIGLACED